MTIQTLDFKDTFLDINVSSGDFSQVEAFAHQVFSRYLVGRPQEISVSQLKGGITNILLQGTCKCDDQSQVQFLVRAYGRGTDSIINRDREYATHAQLHSKGLAPALYARFGNGLVYGFVPGRPIHYTEMSHPLVMRGVANRLAQWHSVLDSESIAKSLGGQTAAGDIWELLERWIDIVPEGVVDSSREELHKELRWITHNIGAKGGPQVVAHCDLLSGNVIVPEAFNSKVKPTNLYTTECTDSSYTPSGMVSFIDYEYTMPAPRAFDLANHFMEWQGFDCKIELIPEPSLANPVLRYWAYHYLSAVSRYKGAVSDKSMDKQIDGLIEELRCWWGMPGFYWGIWSAIQSAMSDIDFDYADYARSRLSEYGKWKQSYHVHAKI